jgi:molybdopterin-guanine dinucleotide biosynthesis protein A
MTFSAVLLAGGESSRMGRDKATIEFGREPLWHRQLELLRKMNPEKLFVSARSTPSWLPENVELLADDPPSRGPLSGLTKALAVMRTTHLVALAVDMPFMTSDEIRELSGLAETGRGVVPMIGERAEPLAAIYPAEAALEFQSALASSDLSLQRIVSALALTHKVRLVPIPEESAKLYRSMNTPDDFAEFTA